MNLLGFWITNLFDGDKLLLNYLNLRLQFELRGN